MYSIGPLNICSCCIQKVRVILRVSTSRNWFLEPAVCSIIMSSTRHEFSVVQNTMYTYNTCTHLSIMHVYLLPFSVSGNPGDYARIGGLRVDECATYGCLFELTIQLAIIMVGKQILNNIQEISLP